MEDVSDINSLGLLVADHINAMLAYWDKDQVCRFANNAYLEWFGRGRAEMVDIITMKELLGPLYEKNLPYITEVLKGNTQQFEREIKLPGGEIRHSLANYYPDIFDGEVRGFFVHVADITKIKKLEKELSSSEQKFKSLLESAPDAVIIANKDEEIQLVNAQTENLFGYPRNELIGKKIETLLPELFRNCHNDQRSSFFSILDTKPIRAGIELYGLHKNGVEFPLEISISPIELEDGTHVSVSIRDITRRKEQEKEINKMATIIASSSDAIMSKTLDGRILTWNKGAENILGYTFDEVKGKHISILFPPELLYEEQMLLSKILNGENIEQYETVRLRKDKVKVDVSITLSAIKDHSGQIVGISKILRDITLQKKTEKETKSLLELTIQQNKRLQNFAQIVSHNLRSYAVNINALLEIYEEKSLAASGNNIFQHIKNSAQSLNETIENLNEVVLINTGAEQNLVPVYLNAAIKSAINNISQLINEAGANVINNVSNDVTIMGIPAYVDSILLNFLTNAIKYRSPNRQSTVVLSAAFQGNLLVLSIEDNGLGIDMKKNANKLFGMYKTFHGNKDARGIGLFITKNQIEAMGATVAVESEIDRGTTIKIYFKHE